jgi:hypothetical protein
MQNQAHWFRLILGAKAETFPISGRRIGELLKVSEQADTQLQKLVDLWIVKHFHLFFPLLL